MTNTQTCTETCTETTAQTGARMSMDEFWQLIDKLGAAGLVRESVCTYEGPADQTAMNPSGMMILVHPGVALTGLPDEVEETRFVGQTENGMMAAFSMSPSELFSEGSRELLFDEDRADAMEWQYLWIEDEIDEDEEAQWNAEWDEQDCLG